MANVINPEYIEKYLYKVSANANCDNPDQEKRLCKLLVGALRKAILNDEAFHKPYNTLRDDAPSWLVKKWDDATDNDYVEIRNLGIAKLTCPT